MHCYCKEVMREAYQDAIKAQTVSVNNKLRLFSMILPNDQNFFQYGFGGIQDNFSYGFVHDSAHFNQEAHKGRDVRIDSILNGEVLYYIPSTDEIMHLEPLSRAGGSDCIIPGGDLIHESQIDAQIKELVKLPHV